MSLSVGFIIVDVLSVTSVIGSSLPEGVNPFWKLAFVFKCFTDTIILDDFKTALDKLKQYKLDHLGSTNGGGSELNERPQILSPNPRRYVPQYTAYTSYVPYNESSGITAAEEAPKDTLAMVDHEMQYWDSHDSTHSTANINPTHEEVRPHEEV